MLVRKENHIKRVCKRRFEGNSNIGFDEMYSLAKQIEQNTGLLKSKLERLSFDLMQKLGDKPSVSNTMGKIDSLCRALGEFKDNFKYATFVLSEAEGDLED